jgi:hypothetical protein
VFKTITPEQKMSATAEYKAGLEAARQRMAEQKAARLAREKWQARRLTFGAPTTFYHSPTGASPPGDDGK